MFKPLLRTLPLLSGNFTIACKLNEIEKESSNDYSTYIRMANIMPLQNNIYDANIELNLLNGKYEFDVQKYHFKYHNVFYGENYLYNENILKELDLNNFNDSNNDSRNKDYEFGCKRIKFSQSKFQFSFYAPFYLDNINDLPEYFCIHIKLNDHLEKRIKIYINDDIKSNYLYLYLSKYFNQVDDRVIYCLQDSLQATYFGIDVKKGGIVQYKDNDIGQLFINQTTINNFDYIICKGFERNNLIMKQVFPISFMFNLNDIFNEYENDLFCGSKVSISGYYYDKKDIKYDFYDFDINYTNSYIKYHKYNEHTGTYEYEYGNNDGKLINVMNVGYPSLNESKYIKYAYTNKITPKYCKWKMMLSSDRDPYITNLSYAYSYLQMPNNKFGYFPTMFKGINPMVCIKNGDLKLPIGNDKQLFYETSTYYANKVYVDRTNIDKYIKLMSNYCSYWFNITNDNILDDSLWSDVKYDYTYYKGILYNLKSLHNYNIDKFGVFVNFDFNYIDESTFNSLVRAKYVLSNSDKSFYTINNFNNSYLMKNNDEFNVGTYSKIYDLLSKSSNKSYVLIDKIMKYDKRGKYVEEKNYVIENTYYKYEDVIKNLRPYIDEELLNKLSNFKLTGYLLLEAENNINFFETYKDIYGNVQKQFMLKDDLFDINGSISSKYSWLYDTLYYSDVRSSEKIKVSSIYKNIEYNEDLYGKIVIYLKEEYIHINDIYNVLSEYSSSSVRLMIYLNNCKKYIYERYKEKNDLVLKDYFEEYKEPYSDVYVDIYNLNNLISLYNKEAKYNNLTKISDIKNEHKMSKFIKLINKDHLFEYYHNLNKDENNYSSLYVKSLLDALYVKQRCWVIDNNTKTIKPKDTYITLNEYILNYSLNYDKKYLINIKNASYDDILDNIGKTDVKSLNAYDLNNDGVIDVADLSAKITVNDLIIANMGKTDIDSLNAYDLNNDGVIDVADLSYATSKKNYTDDYLELLKIAAKYKYIIDNYTNLEILKWLCDNLSNTRESYNKFKLNLFGIELTLDLCIKKEVILLNNDLVKFIKNDNKTSNFLYLYINNSCKNENMDIWPIVDINKVSNQIYNDIDNYLTPLFTSPYLNNVDIENELNMIENNKIKDNKYIYNEGKYFKEIDIYETLKQIILPNDITSTIDEIENKWQIYCNEKITEDQNYKLYALNNISSLDQNEINKYKLDKIKFIYDNFIDYVYDELLPNKEVVLYSIYDILDIKFDEFDVYKNLTYDKKNKIYIYKHNNLTYAFYNIYLTIDNTNNSFNVYNDYNLNIYFNSINGINLKSINKLTYKNDKKEFYSSNSSKDSSIKKYLNKIFYILYPFLKINIFNEFSKNITTIIYPHESEIFIKYIQSEASSEKANEYKMLKENESDVLYDKIIQIENAKKIKLLRYFNYISPYIKKTSVINDVWKLKFKQSENDEISIDKNIFYKENVNIYAYDKILLYLVQTDEYKKISQYEYKHFNDNLIINLPEEIIINDTKIYSKKDISKLNENLNEVKLSILLKYFKSKKLDYTNIILFLFNKYDSSINIEKYGLISNENKYKVSYKFKLI